MKNFLIIFFILGLTSLSAIGGTKVEAELEEGDRLSSMVGGASAVSGRKGADRSAVQKKLRRFAESMETSVLGCAIEFLEDKKYVSFIQRVVGDTTLKDHGLSCECGSCLYSTISSERKGALALFVRVIAGRIKKLVNILDALDGTQESWMSLANSLLNLHLFIQSVRDIPLSERGKNMRSQEQIRVVNLFTNSVLDCTPIQQGNIRMLLDIVLPQTPPAFMKLLQGVSEKRDLSDMRKSGLRDGGTVCLNFSGGYKVLLSPWECGAVFQGRKERLGVVHIFGSNTGMYKFEYEEDREVDCFYVVFPSGLEVQMPEFKKAGKKKFSNLIQKINSDVGSLASDPRSMEQLLEFLGESVPESAASKNKRKKGALKNKRKEDAGEEKSDEKVLPASIRAWIIEHYGNEESYAEVKKWYREPAKKQGHHLKSKHLSFLHDIIKVENVSSYKWGHIGGLMSALGGGVLGRSESGHFYLGDYTFRLHRPHAKDRNNLYVALVSLLRMHLINANVFVRDAHDRLSIAEVYTAY